MDETSVILAQSAATGGLSWYIWPLLLFLTTFILGVVSIPAGVGGGVLFVPLVSALFPFHLDFVRATGLMIALAGALSASPSLLRNNLASLRLALPAALVASTFSIIGATMGLALPEHILQISLGIVIFGISVVFMVSKNSDVPAISGVSSLNKVLGIKGEYKDSQTGKKISWTVSRTARGYASFSLIGFLAGMFGLGAGWANVPVLNLVMGAPLKVAVGTSVMLLSVTDTTAAWVYINKGTVLPLIAVPSMLGMILGSKVGVFFLAKAKPKAVRMLVIAMLFAAGLRSIYKGVSLWL